MTFETMPHPMAGQRDAAAASDDSIAQTTIPWLRLTRQDSHSERTMTRVAAAHLPFLLAPELDDITWSHRRLWDAPSVLDHGSGLSGVDLLALCDRMDRILVTRDTRFLDDRIYPPERCPGVIVIEEGWQEKLDEFLVTIVGLLGTVPELYRHVKVHGADSGELTISALEGRGRRVLRRYLVDADGLPLLSELEQIDECASALH
jgi:hypothetical protein